MKVAISDYHCLDLDAHRKPETYNTRIHAMTNLQTTQTDSAARPVVVYDGHCPFCLRQVERMRRRDTAGVFEYVPRQAEGLEQRFPKLAEGDFNTGMRLVHTDASISMGADAVYHIARRLPGTKYLAWLYRVPGLNWVFRVGYAWVAEHRYKLAKKCEDGACDI